MRKTMIAAAVLSALSAGQAGAADALGSTTPYAPYGPVNSAQGFGGFYAGGNLGYGGGEYAPDNAGTSDIEGFLGGAQAGYNADLGGLVIGVEGDYQLSAVKFDETVAGENVSVGVNHFGTVRGRAGIDLGGIMPYATGGIAFGDVGYERETAAGPTISDSEYGWGIAAGAGVEALAANNLSLKAEYLYVGFGGLDFGNATVDAHAHTARAGINFHF